MTGKPDSTYQFFDVSDETPQSLTSPRTSPVYNFDSIGKGTVSPSSPCRGCREDDLLHDCSTFQEQPTMKTIATLLSGLQLASRPSLVARLPDFITLMKPRVMMLAVFTALVGLASAPRELDPLHTFVAVLAIAAGAGAAGVLNMWYDADIDAIMARTAMRPIPRGKVSRFEALILGLFLGGFAVVALASATNLTAAA